MTILDERGTPAGGSVPSDCSAPTAQALFEEARQRRRRRHLLFASAVVLLVFIAAIVTWTVQPDGNSGSPRRVLGNGRFPAGTSVPHLPAHMVVWAENSSKTTSIEVITSKTGRVVRVLATDHGLFRSTPQPTVSGSGTVYFDDSIPATPGYPAPGSSPPLEQIMSVPLTGGTPEFVAQGHDPAVSPNGQWLAYEAFTDITDQPEAIIVVDLTLGATSTWQFSSTGPDLVNGLFWSPDSRSLVYTSQAFVHGVSNVSTRLLDLSDPSRSLEAAPELRLPLCPVPNQWAPPGTGRAIHFAGFLSANQALGTCYHAGLTSQTEWTRPEVVNLTTDDVVERLPVLPGQFGPGGFEVDPSGHYLSFIGHGTGAGGVYRWSISEGSGQTGTRPVLVRNGVGSSSWVPSRLQRTTAR